MGVKEDKSREVLGIFNRPIQRDFMKVLRMREAMPTEESVTVLMAKTATPDILIGTLPIKTKNSFLVKNYCFEFYDLTIINFFNFF